MATVQFEINGLTSHRDGEHLARSLATLGGVAAVRVHSATGTVTITGQGATTDALESTARGAVRAAGYELASYFGPHASRWSRRWLRPHGAAVRTRQA